MSVQPPDGPTPDDLVSAYLDGEVGADERARVEGDPALRARVEQLRAVRAVLQAPIEQPPEAEVDRIIAAAVDAATDGPAAVAPAAFDELATRRRRSVPAWLSVAAVILALLLAVPLLGSLGGDDSEDSGEETAAMTADDAGDSAGGEERLQSEAAPEEESAATGAAAAPAPADGGDLGAIDGAEQLREVVGPAVLSRALASPAPAAGSGEDGAEGGGVGDSADPGTAADQDVSTFAAEPACSSPDLGAPVFHARARYEGTDAVVVAYELPEGTRVIVFALEGCGRLADVTL